MYDTYPKEANNDSRWQQETVSYDEANEPNKCESPADEFVASVCSGQEIPALKCARANSK